MTEYPRCALVVEPSDSFRADLHAALLSLCIQANAVSSAQQGMQCLSLGFDLVVVSADLAAGALELVESALSLRQPPAVFVTGHAPAPSCVFELAKAGARAYLEPPVTAAILQHCLCAHGLASHLLKVVRPLVGHLGLKEIQALVRHALLSEALARTNGSRRSAAQLLGVTRPAIQKWLRSAGSDELAAAKGI